MDLLPLEIIEHFLGLLDVRSRLNARLVCNDWRQAIIFYSYKVNYLTREQLLQLIERMSTLTHPIGLTLAKTRFHSNESPSDQYKELLEISRLTNLTRFIIPDRNYDWFPLENWMCLTTLTNLQQIHVQPLHTIVCSQLLPYLPNITIIEANDEDTVNNLTHLTNLQSLTLNLSRVQNHQILDNLKFPEKLTSLVAQVQAMIDVNMMTRMTGLKHLQWKSYNSQSFPQHHLLPNLESLNVQIAYVIPQSWPERLDLNTNLTLLRFNLDPVNDPRSEELTVLTKLKALAIDFTINRDIPQVSFLTPLTALETLTLKRRGDLSDNLFVPHIRSTNLTELVLDATSVHFSKKISQLTYLERVAVNNGWYMYFLTELKNLTALISLANEQSHDQYQFVSKLTTLRELSINSFNNEKFELNAADLINLEHLHLTVRSVDQVFNGLPSLTKLTYLHIIADNVDLVCLSRMTDLTYLYVPQKSRGFWTVATQLTGLLQLTILCDTTDEEALSLMSLTRLTGLVFPKTVSYEVRSKFKHVHK